MTASVYYDTELRCDERGCKAKYHTKAHWNVTRQRAAREGWVYHSIRGDLCPLHARPAPEEPR